MKLRKRFTETQSDETEHDHESTERYAIPSQFCAFCVARRRRQLQ